VQPLKTNIKRNIPGTFSTGLLSTSQTESMFTWTLENMKQDLKNA
jgi:hypothetical protein